MPKLTSIDGGKMAETKIEFQPETVFCESCNSGLFAWKVDARNQKNHLLVCATCQEYYPILDVDDIFSSLLNLKPQGEDETDG